MGAGLDCCRCWFVDLLHPNATGIRGGLWAGNPLVDLENGIRWMNADSEYERSFRNAGVDVSFNEQTVGP